MTTDQKFCGKYRGRVADNVDPERCGRIRATVAEVAGSMPCVPIAGMQSGAYFVSPIGASVWVEFERGDPDCPLWVGGFWSSAEAMPALALASNPACASIVLQPGLHNVVSLSDSSARP